MTGRNGAVCIGGAFKRAHRGGAHGNHPAAFALGFGYHFRRLLAYLVILAVHLVGGYGVLLYGAEGAQPHVQEYLRYLHAHALYLFQKLRGEVQARGGRGGRAVCAGVYRLVAVLIF